MNFYKLGTIILAALLLGCAVAYFYFYFLKSKPEKTVKEFHIAICDGQIEVANSKLSASVTMPTEYIKIGLSSFVKTCKENGGFEQIVFTEIKTQGETSEVKGFVKYKNNQQTKFDTRLYYENGEWKIAMKP